MSKILIVEDEKPIREFIAINLKREKYEVVEAVSGEEALSLLKDEEVDLVILDIMLPGIDGYEVCRNIRENLPDTAIIMVTAKSQDMDKVIGLELGADDYVIKPFNTYELIARIRSVLRRTKKTSALKSQTIIDGSLKINPVSQMVYKNGNVVELTPKEFGLLLTLAKSPGEVFERNRLLDIVWDEEYFGDTKTVDVHIRRLREKIEDNPSQPVYIETVWGVGYRWRLK
ncbi:MAG TPA: response regulator transcription factor [Thermoanaerobacterales bacterium]|jgi:DNA-binding response OmpR family regulator|nr:response regulator transcription factor [Thermoanaerobacterales bacterium]